MHTGLTLAAVSAALLLSVTAPGAMAQEGKTAGDIMIRARVIGLLPDEDSRVTVIGGQVDASNAYTGEVDFTYFFTDNIAAELIAATTKHRMAVEGSSSGHVGLGDVWLLPPTLTAQYHFAPKAAFSPYVGAGLTYAVFYNEDVPSSLRSVNYDDALGYALQVGFDYRLDRNWYFNADVKKIFLNTDVRVVTNAGTVIDADVDLDPWVVGIGLGYKF